MIVELGRLTQDVKVQDVKGGKKVLNNCVAIRVSKDVTTFVDVVAWDSTAELIGKNFRKGFEIFFEGQLINTKKFVAKDVEAQGVAVVIDKVRFTHGNPQEGSDSKAEDDFLK